MRGRTNRSTPHSRGLRTLVRRSSRSGDLPATGEVPGSGPRACPVRSARFMGLRRRGRAEAMSRGEALAGGGRKWQRWAAAAAEDAGVGGGGSSDCRVLLWTREPLILDHSERHCVRAKNHGTPPLSCGREPQDNSTRGPQALDFVDWGDGVLKIPPALARMATPSRGMPHPGYHSALNGAAGQKRHMSSAFDSSDDGNPDKADSFHPRDRGQPAQEFGAKYPRLHDSVDWGEGALNLMPGKCFIRPSGEQTQADKR